MDKIYYILFRLSNFTNLIPYIDIVFDANQKTLIILTVYCSKIGKKFNINLSYYKDLIRVNSRSYDDFINTKIILKINITVFGSGFDHGDRNRIEGKCYKKTKRKIL